MTPARRILDAANVAALTEIHNRHAERMREMAKPDPAVEGVTRMARILANQHAPRHDTGLYSLADTETLYARRLLLQATMALFDGTAEGRLLRAMDAWLTLGSRQRHYTEADSAEIERIGGALTDAATAILDEMIALQSEIDGD